MTVKAFTDPAAAVRVEAALATGELARTYRSRGEAAPAAVEEFAERTLRNPRRRPVF